MSLEKFRQVALSLPLATEGSHMGHPDFRVKGKIFATIMPSGDDGVCGMIKLTPAQQRQFIKTDPDVFEPVKGGWGARGATKVHLGGTKKAVLRRAILAAWRNTAPKRLVEELGPADAD